MFEVLVFKVCIGNLCQGFVSRGVENVLVSNKRVCSLSTYTMTVGFVKMGWNFLNM